MTQDQAIQKVRDLLALATSSNEHEAAQAASLAAKLMEKYRIEQAMLDEVPGTDEVTVNDALLGKRVHKKVVPWYWNLAWAVAHANRCVPLYFDTAQGIRVGFAGKPSNATVCRDLLDWLADVIDKLANEYGKERIQSEVRNWNAGVGRTLTDPRKALASFRMGAVATIKERLSKVATEVAQEHRLQIAGDVTALAKLETALARLDDDDQAMRKWLTQEFEIEFEAGKNMDVDEAAYRAGQRAGETIELDTTTDKEASE